MSRWWGALWKVKCALSMSVCLVYTALWDQNNAGKSRNNSLVVIWHWVYNCNNSLRNTWSRIALIYTASIPKLKGCHSSVISIKIDCKFTSSGNSWHQASGNTPLSFEAEIAPPAFLHTQLQLWVYFSQSFSLFNDS